MLFRSTAGDSGLTISTLDRIFDWESGDKLDFGAGATAVEGSTYLELSASTYELALSLATGQIAAGTVDYVAVQVGSDVVVFADNGGTANTVEDAVVLVGRTLADISASNILGS